MNWLDYLYTKGITEGDLTAAQHAYWRGLWEKEYGPQIKLPPAIPEVDALPPVVSEVKVEPQKEITPAPDAGEIQ